ncbi:MAG: ParB/RepB/Spo0J family partition protein [Burkholderiales bacterium]|nr:ParB/RepB/Spo0J family partition protein [Burkholderiales bacterium]
MSIVPRRDYPADLIVGTMPNMRMPWSRTGEQQLDLLGDVVVPEAAAAARTARSAAARPASMVATTLLFEDTDNPRTEVPDAELGELAQDIRARGILQPIVVHPADRDGRHRIHFGAKRWRAAQRIGLAEVPVVVRAGPADPYAQVAENLKRHALSPLDLARFFKGRIEAGDSNAKVAQTLGIDQTTIAHHLALLDLPPVLDAALKSGRCNSPRTLYELGKLHAVQPDKVAQIVDGSGPITRESVALIRDAVPQALAGKRPTRVGPPPTSHRSTQALMRARTLCDRLDALLLRLTRPDAPPLPADDLADLGRRIASMASRIVG